MGRMAGWVLAACCAVALWGGEVRAQTLDVVTEGSYPPFSYVDMDNELTGFDVDFAHALCKEMGVECTVRTVPWDTIIDGLAAGEYDMIVASLARTPEREELVAFSRRYYRSRSAFVGPKRLQRDGALKDLTGLVLCAQAHTVQAEYLEEHFGDRSGVVLVDTQDDALRLLLEGEVDAVLSDSLLLYEFLTSPVGEGYEFVGDPLPTDDPSATAHIAVRKEDAALLEAVNKAITVLRLNGVYDRINRKYFPFSIY